MKKIIIFAVVFVCLGIGAYFLFFNSNGEEYTFRYDKINKGDISVVVTSTGTLSAVNTIQVGSQVSGTVSKLYADFNSIVKAGQLIAQIDPTFLQQAVNDAEATIERARAQFNNSQRNLDRIKSLNEKKLNSQQDYDAALTDFEVTKAALKQAEAGLERAKINLSYATIFAPVDGVVIDRKIDVGQTVAASFSAPTLFTIAMDLSKMQVQATVDESDIGKVSIGQDVTFTVDAYSDEKFYGKISQIRLSPVVVQNVVNYTVVIDVPNNELKLMPGMTANVKILIAKKQGIIKVPNIALRFQPPTELVDTIKMKEMREAFRNRGSMGSRDSSQNQSGQKGNTDQKNFAQNNKPNSQQSNPQTHQNNSQSPDQRGGKGNHTPQENIGSPSQGQQGNFQFSPQDREKFKKMRDSIQAAHGGNLSREEIMQEMQKAFRRPSKPSVPSAKPSQTVMGSTGIGGYEIIKRYPQYEKNSIIPTEQSGMGRIWILNSKGKLEPIFVRTGLNDGQSTEIITDKLTEGQQIVIGAFSNSQTAQAGKNPLTNQPQGQGPQQFMGGGRGR
jgi:HlyD family secretion protein